MMNVCRGTPGRPARWWYQRAWVVNLAAMDVLVGVAYLLGPTNAPSLQLAQTIAPIGLWVLLLAAAGGALCARWYIPAGIGGSIVWLFFALVTAITVARHTATSAAGLPLFGGMAVFHLLVTVGAVRGLMSMGRSSD